MSCPMCGQPDLIDGYCCTDHREIHVREHEAATLRQTLLQIVALGEDGAWYVEMARAAHTGTARS